jgi:hypothetical protein
MPKNLRKAMEDDVEGHRKSLRKAIGEDDTEGHRKRLMKAAEDDTEGHRHRLAKATEDDEDVEGHSLLPDPTTGRLLAAARERDIQASLRRRALESEARRPFNRNKG